eukprot:scaffold2700_cov388-Prasinococcus_capsulatus_cf.AAC.3
MPTIARVSGLLASRTESERVTLPAQTARLLAQVRDRSFSTMMCMCWLPSLQQRRVRGSLGYPWRSRWGRSRYCRTPTRPPSAAAWSRFSVTMSDSAPRNVGGRWGRAIGGGAVPPRRGQPHPVAVLACGDRAYAWPTHVQAGLAGLG